MHTCINYWNTGLKGHSHLYDRADLDTSFPTLKKVPLNPKSKLRVEYFSKSASIVVVCRSIFNHLLKKLFLSVLLYILWYYFIVFCKKQYQSHLLKNMKRRGGKREGAGRKNSPTLAKMTREINRKHWKVNHHGKSRFLDLAKGSCGGNLRERFELCVMAARFGA